GLVVARADAARLRGPRLRAQSLPRLVRAERADGRPREAVGLHRQRGRDSAAQLAARRALGGQGPEARGGGGEAGGAGAGGQGAGGEGEGSKSDAGLARQSRTHSLNLLSRPAFIALWPRPTPLIGADV